MLTKQQIEAEGFVDQHDRGMAENNGYFFEGPEDFTIRYWTGRGRMQLEQGSRVVFDGKCHTVELLKTLLEITNYRNL